MGRRSSKDAANGLDELLDAAAVAFEEGRYDDVRLLSQRAIAADPRSGVAWHFDGAAHLELGDVAAAAEGYLKALSLAPDDVEILAGAAELFVAHFGEEREAIERGLELCRKGLKLARRAKDTELEAEFLLLRATGLNQLGEPAAALEAVEQALTLAPGSLDLALERAYALFELCRFDEAKGALEQLVRDEPDEAWAHHHLGLLAERRGDLKEARRHFARAEQLAPDEFPPPVTLSEDAFDRAVEDAVGKLPEQVKKYLDNTTIAVEPIPSDEDLVSSSPPLSPTILGVFRGVAVGERSVTSAFDHFPASIVLYQRNLERFAKSRDELIEQIGITLMHEVGHLIGLDEEDLWERGLD